MLLDSVVLDVAALPRGLLGKHERVDIHLCVEPGSFLLVEGAALSGKTALLHELVREAVAKGARVGMVASNPALTLSGIFGDVAGEIELASRMSLDRHEPASVAAILAVLDLERLAKRDIWSLSGGEMVRLAIGRCAARHVDIIVIDDVWTSLDAESAKLVLSFLQALCASGTRCVWAHTSDSGSAEALYMAKTMVLNLPDPSGPAESALDTLAETVFARASHSQGGLETQELAFGYGPGANFRMPEMHLDPGDRLVLQARNGGGKTTFLKLMCGVLEPEAGNIALGGVRLNAHARQKLARLQTQEAQYQLYRRSFWEELVTALRLKKNELRRIRESLCEGLSPELLQSNPFDLPRPVQRLLTCLLATADARHIVLLDEPTAGLDRRFAHLVTRLVGAASEAGRIVIAASHDPAFITSINARGEALPEPAEPRRLHSNGRVSGNRSINIEK